VESEAITSDKISDNAVLPNHFSDSSIVLSKIACEIQDQNQGVGEPSQQTPPRLEEDQWAKHVLLKEYFTKPHIILTNQCDCHLYINDVKLEERTVIVFIGIGQRFSAQELKYTLMVISND
jgi:hypothetical protein